MRNTTLYILISLILAYAPLSNAGAVAQNLRIFSEEVQKGYFNVLELMLTIIGELRASDFLCDTILGSGCEDDLEEAIPAYFFHAKDNKADTIYFRTEDVQYSPGDVILDIPEEGFVYLQEAGESQKLCGIQLQAYREINLSSCNLPSASYNLYFTEFSPGGSSVRASDNSNISTLKSLLPNDAHQHITSFQKSLESRDFDGARQTLDKIRTDVEGGFEQLSDTVEAGLVSLQANLAADEKARLRAKKKLAYWQHRKSEDCSTLRMVQRLRCWTRVAQLNAKKLIKITYNKRRIALIERRINKKQKKIAKKQTEREGIKQVQETSKKQILAIDEQLLSASNSDPSDGFKLAVVHWLSDDVTLTLSEYDSGNDQLIYHLDCPLSHSACRDLNITMEEDMALFQWKDTASPISIDKQNIQLDYIASEQTTEITVKVPARQFEVLGGFDIKDQAAFHLNLSLRYPSHQPITTNYKTSTLAYGAYEGELRGVFNEGITEIKDNNPVLRWRKQLAFNDETLEGKIVSITDEDEACMDYDDYSYVFSLASSVSYDETNYSWVDLVSLDTNSDGLDDLVEVLSNEQKTTLRVYPNSNTYGDIGCPLSNYDLDEVVEYVIPNSIGKVSSIKAIQGASYVKDQTHGAQYLALHSLANQQVQLVALVQEKGEENPDVDNLKIVTADPLPNVIASTLAYKGMSQWYDARWNGEEVEDSAHKVMLATVHLNRPETQGELPILQANEDITYQARLYQLIEEYDGWYFADTTDLDTGNPLLDSAQGTLQVESLEDPLCQNKTVYTGDISILWSDKLGQDNQHNLMLLASRNEQCQLQVGIDRYGDGRHDYLVVKNAMIYPNGFAYVEYNYESSTYEPMEAPQDHNNPPSIGARTIAASSPLLRSLDVSPLGEQNDAHVFEHMRDNCNKYDEDTGESIHTDTDGNCTEAGLLEWKKLALNTANNATAFSDCNDDQTLNAFVNCIYSQSNQILNGLSDGYSWASATHEFEYQNTEDGHVIVRTDRRTQETENVYVTRSFNNLVDYLESQLSDSSQTPSINRLQGSSQTLAAATLTLLVPSVHAGAEIVFCLESGPFAPACMLSDLVMTATAGAVLMSQLCDWHLGGVAGDFICDQKQQDTVSPEYEYVYKM